MRIVEAAWLAHPHPDLADAYAHVRLGDSARPSGWCGVETLAAKTPGDIEGRAAIARAATDATEFARAREGAGGVHGDADAAGGDADGRDRAHRAWRFRQGAGLDLARGARPARSGLDRGRLVSDRWRPVSPVTGRLDAFQWQTPVASLPSDKGATIEASPFEEAMLAARHRAASKLAHESVPSRGRRCEQAPELAPRPATRTIHRCARARNQARIQDRTQSRRTAAPAAKPAEPVPVPAPAPVVSAPEPPPAAPQPEPPPPAAPAPLFRARSDLGRLALGKRRIAPVPAVIPILRAPDDPGIDDEAPVDEFTEKIGTPRAQAGGWRGFWSRWGS